MGESFTAPALSGAKTAVTYSSSKEEVATVDNDGEVTLVGAGTTVITATAAADDTYAAGSASYTLIVSPAPSTDVLTLPWNEDFSGDLSAYTIGNGGGTTKLFNEALSAGTAPEILIAKTGGFLTATINPEGYTGALTLTFKSNYPSRIQVTSGTSGVEISKVSDTEYQLNITTSVSEFDVTLTNTTGSNTRVDDISLIKGGTQPEPPAGGGDLEAVDVTLDFTKQGYVNAQEVTSLTVDGVTVTLDKGTNSNTPKWYDSGKAVRVYGGGTFTISAGSNITGVKLYFGTGDGTNEITADKGSFDGAVWTGSAKSVVFTVGGSTGNRRIQKIEVSTN
ncbi:MAG: Ig-like domain-containing protein [Bacteroidales bacterium]|nr:Ig-like domain-containing protein [Bacteroidales bacterium]